MFKNAIISMGMYFVLFINPAWTGDVHEVVLVSNPPKEHCPEVEAITNRIVDVLDKVGATVVRPKIWYFVRDAKVRTADDSLLRMIKSYSDLTGIAEILQKRDDFLKNNSARAATDHRSFSDIKLSLSPYINLEYAFDGLSPKSRTAWTVNYPDRLGESAVDVQVKPSRTYQHAGNFILAKRADGRTKIFLGEDMLHITRIRLENLGYFGNSHPASAAYHEEYERTYSSTFGGDQISQLYLANKIPPIVQKLGQEMNLSDDAIIKICQELEAMGYIKDFGKDRIEQFRPLALNYIGQQEFIKKYIWPLEFGVQAEDIIAVPQAAYHLDLFMHYHNGIMFLNDYGKTLELLQKIQSKVKNKNEKDIYGHYTKSATMLQRDLGPIYAKIKMLIEDAGIPVVLTPGCFHAYAINLEEIKVNQKQLNDLTDKYNKLSQEQRNAQSLKSYIAEALHEPDTYKFAADELNINFMNAFSGFSLVTKRPYYVCLGSPEKQIGKKIMNNFEEFLKQHIKNVDVHFIGKDSAQVVRANNKTGNYAGVHCLTAELKTSRFQ
ncbi:MAG TPA: hypothetical protein VEL47_00950 [Myxococcota bacterium]|nr:hypothetical protein [Myxococcota bacterium]